MDRILVLTVDRDDDLGNKTSIRGPESLGASSIDGCDGCPAGLGGKPSLSFGGPVLCP